MSPGGRAPVTGVGTMPGRSEVKNRYFPSGLNAGTKSANGESTVGPRFHVDDVDAARVALVVAGVRMRDVHRYSGFAFCDGIDPEGNVFQITTR
jgi:hypothetical protein